MTQSSFSISPSWEMAFASLMALAMYATITMFKAMMAATALTTSAWKVEDAWKPNFPRTGRVEEEGGEEEGGPKAHRVH